MKIFKLFLMFPQKYECFFYENKNNILVIFVTHSQRRQTEILFFDGQSCIFIAENSREILFVSMRFARG